MNWSMISVNKRLVVGIFVVMFFAVNVYAQAVDPIGRATDYDGDNLGDLIVYDSTLATFNVRQSSNGEFAQEMVGIVGDVPAVADFNGDGQTDLGTFSRVDGRWSIKITGGSTRNFKLWSRSRGDIPLPGDYSGSGCEEAATYNKRLGIWTFADCEGVTRDQFKFGGPGMIAVPGDYDCDGISDPAVFDQLRNFWMVRESTKRGAVHQFQFGRHGDMPAQADWDGDGCIEGGLYRGKKKVFITNVADYGSSLGTDLELRQWGLDGDFPILMNVDGDRKPDFGVYRPDTGTFLIFTSSEFFFTIPFPSLFGGYVSPGNWEYGTHSSINPRFPGLWQFNRNRVLGDYDRDGLSDFVAASVNRTAGTTTFSIHDGQGVGSVVVNAPGDAIVPGDYNGDGMVQPAVVTVLSNAALQWTIKNAYGIDSTSFFGINGDQPLVGDVDCDGRADKAVARTVDGFVYWFFELSGGGTLFDFLHGLDGDTVFLADVNGDGCDELVNARSGDDGWYWFFRGIYEDEVHIMQWGLESDTPMRPNDVNGDGFEDLIVARDVGAQRSLLVRHSDPRFINSAFPDFPFVERKFGLSSDVSLLGDFSGANKSEVAVFRRTGFVVPAFIYSKHGKRDWIIPHGASNSVIVRPDGTIAQATSSVGVPLPGGSAPGCDASPGTDSDFLDGARRGALWKPVSEGVANGASVALLPISYCGASLSALGADGSVVSGIQRTKCGGNGNRAHFWFSKTARQMAAYAPITVKVEHRGTTECRSVPDPTNRYD